MKSSPVFIRRPSDLGAIVRAARKARALNQQDLADRLGVSRWWVNEFERGKSTARLDIVLRALNELDITLSASLGEGTPRRGPAEAASGDVIDIDEIAQTGLTTPRPAPAPRKRRRR
jgi:y4mF family transcriptional regulator